MNTFFKLQFIVNTDTFVAIDPKIIAAWLLGIPPRDKPLLTFYSAIHRTTIITNYLISFLTSNINPHRFRQQKFYQNYQEAIKKIYLAESLWESVSKKMIEFGKYVKENWLRIPTNTRLVERWVKYSNKCNFNTTYVGLADVVAILRLNTMFHFR